MSRSALFASRSWSASASPGSRPGRAGGGTSSGSLFPALLRQAANELVAARDGSPSRACHLCHVVLLSALRARKGYIGEGDTSDTPRPLRCLTLSPQKPRPARLRCWRKPCASSD